MHAIEKQFNSLRKTNPCLSSYTCFSQAIKRKGYPLKDMKFYFDKPVDKDDYFRDEKGHILEFLYDLAERRESPKHAKKRKPNHWIFLRAKF